MPLIFFFNVLMAGNSYSSNLVSRFRRKGTVTIAVCSLYLLWSDHEGCDILADLPAELLSAIMYWQKLFIALCKFASVHFSLKEYDTFDGCLSKINSLSMFFVLFFFFTCTFNFPLKKIGNDPFGHIGWNQRLWGSPDYNVVILVIN